MGDAPSTYSVMRGTASGGPYQQIASVPASVLTYVDTSATGNVLTEGQTYCYVILGTNASGSGPVSNEKCGVVPLSLPGAPSLTSASFK